MVAMTSVCPFDCAFFDDLKAVARKRDWRVVRVGKQDHLVDSERRKDLGADAVASKRRSFGGLSGTKIGRARQRSRRSGMQRYDDARTFLLNHSHRALQLARTWARLSEDIGEQVEA